MRQLIRFFCVPALVLLSMTTPALAYIGPGMGIGAIAVVFGVLGAIVLALFAVIYYPMKRMIKARKASKAAQKATSDD